jgi:hypothetical protein
MTPTVREGKGEQFPLNRTRGEEGMAVPNTGGKGLSGIFCNSGVLAIGSYGTGVI